MIGEAVPVIENVRAAYGVAQYSISREGTLIYFTGSGFGRELVWVYRDGRVETLGLKPDNYLQPRLSPDGEHIALVIAGADVDLDLWVYSMTRGTLARLTLDDEIGFMPLWHPDSQLLVYSSATDAQPLTLFMRAANGTGTANKLTMADGSWHYALSWLAGGKGLVLQKCKTLVAACDMALLPSSDEQSVKLSLRSSGGASISPDGKWIAFQSDESGQLQIYVRPFPQVDSGRWQVSIDGGRHPQWGPEAREIFYWGPTDLMVVPVASGPAFKAGQTKALFSLADYEFNAGRNYAVDPDGQRLLMIRRSRSQAQKQRMVLVENWFDELERLVPTK